MHEVAVLAERLGHRRASVRDLAVRSLAIIGAGTGADEKVRGASTHRGSRVRSTDQRACLRVVTARGARGRAEGVVALPKGPEPFGALGRRQRDRAGPGPCD